MKTIFIFLFIGSLALSCNNNKKPSGWSKAEKDAFMTNCVSGAKASMGDDKANSYCSCMLGKIEAKYPDASKADQATMGNMTDMAKDCLK